MITNNFSTEAVECSSLEILKTQLDTALSNLLQLTLLLAEEVE